MVRPVRGEAEPRGSSAGSICDDLRAAKGCKTTVAGTRSHDSAGAENGKQVRNAAADRSVHRKQHRSMCDVADFRSEDAESLRLVASLCMEMKRTDKHDVCESH